MLRGKAVYASLLNELIDDREEFILNGVPHVKMSPDIYNIFTNY